MQVYCSYNKLAMDGSVMFVANTNIRGFNTQLF